MQLPLDAFWMMFIILIKIYVFSKQKQNIRCTRIVQYPPMASRCKNNTSTQNLHCTCLFGNYESNFKLVLPLLNSKFEKLSHLSMSQYHPFYTFKLKDINRPMYRRDSQSWSPCSRLLVGAKWNKYVRFIRNSKS